MQIFFIFQILLALIASGRPTYEVKHINDEVTIDGLGMDPHWAQAKKLTDFIHPWNELPAPYTEFRALWDHTYFYFRFQATDNHIIAPGDPNDKRGVLPSDRVEIFFKANGDMDPYYCLEMDPRGRVLDYIARYYRKVDFDWEWPEQDLEVKASYTTNEYLVEGRITLNSLREMGILNGQQMDAGLFRGDYYPVEGADNDVNWISWIRPASEKPDFHIPSAFGRFLLVE